MIKFLAASFFLMMMTPVAGAPLAGTSSRFKQPAPSVAIVQNYSDTEIATLQAYLSEMGINSQVFDQGFSFAAVQGFNLVIWDDLGNWGGGITDSDVIVFQQVMNAGIPLYFIGDDLAASGPYNLNQSAAVWTSLLHLQPGGNIGGNGSVVFAAVSHPVLQGPFGTAVNFAYDWDVDDTVATSTGELVLATSGNDTALLAYEQPGTGVRTVTQNFLAVDGAVNAGATAERKKIFQNSVTWLLDMTGLVGYWPFDGTSTDGTSGGRHFSMIGGVEFGPGLFGQALALTGDPTKFAARSDDDDEFDFGTDDFTLQVWVNFTSTQGNQVVLEKFTGSTGPGWSLVKSATNTWQFYAAPAVNIESGIQSIAPNAWHQLVVLREGTSIQVIYDGINVVGGTISGSLPNTTAGLLLGKRNDAAGQAFLLNGRIDEVAIWNGALTNQQIAGFYNGGNGNPVKGVASSPAPEQESQLKFGFSSAPERDDILPCAAGTSAAPMALLALAAVVALATIPSKKRTGSRIRAS